MPPKRRILIQLDTDPQASVFDRVVAIDSGVDVIFSHSQVTLDQVQGLVHGAIFTRAPSDLCCTAIFIGGSNVHDGQAVLKRTLESFVSHLRVSVMLDSNGANTTAAAAVHCASRHLALAGGEALVLGGTGPVGQRVARLLARQGSRVRLGSRSRAKGETVAASINEVVGRDLIASVQTNSPDDLTRAIDGVQLVIAAGAAGVRLLTLEAMKQARSLRVAIDLNAVPPTGIEGIDVMDKAKTVEHLTVYGAIGAGGIKMKIHRAAISALFERNDRVLDAESIFELAARL
jgi:hypothetical protein